MSSSGPTTLDAAVPGSTGVLHPSDKGEKARAERIPSLDGIRAISILAVILGHLAGTEGFPQFATRIIRNPYVDLAALGVRVFFVISGFLITGLLRREHEREGKIRLGRFYMRRTLRIFPAYFAFLFVVLALAWLDRVSITRSDMLHAFTYTVNYKPDRSWEIGHLWSLSVEEQFYLLWPALILLAGLARSANAAIVAVVAVPLVRVGVWYLAPDRIDTVGVTFETAADALAVGCLLALCADVLWRSPRYRSLVLQVWPAWLLLLAGLALTTRVRPGFALGMTLTNVAVALLIDGAVRSPGSRQGRLLNSRVLAFIGTMSYSLYLWQQLFLDRTHPSTLTAFPVNVLAATAVALASLYLVERPMLSLRARIEKAFFRSAESYDSAAQRPPTGTGSSRP
jgi:peptidoglycan/LPS O-acetylase OafA/YrhL